ncbi:hypothetical protein L0F63_000829 [Massospora cicadina]|nr:hypothetical protein L0F63_000829 [Massospora cicadina]
MPLIKPSVTNYRSDNPDQPRTHPSALANGLDGEDRVVWGGIHLQRGVTLVALFTYLTCVFLSIALVVFLNQIQTFVLTFILKNSSELGSLLGLFAFWDEVISTPCVCIWGMVSDLTGRRAVFSVGFGVIGVSLLLYTLPRSAVPELLLVRLLFAVGSSACTSMLAAGLADIVGVNNGLTSSLVGTFSGLGAVFAIFLLVPLPSLIDTLTTSHEDSVDYTLYLVGGIALVWAGVTAVGYQRPASEISGQPLRSMGHKVKGAVKDFPRAVSLFGSDIKIAMGYISGFVARGDTVILTVFITAWTVKHFIETGRCHVDGEIGVPDSGTAKRVCVEAYRLSMMLSGLAQVFALLGAPLVGLMLTRLRASTVLTLTSMVGVVGYFGFGFAGSPTSKLNFLWVCMLGFGEIGTIVTSLSLLSAPGTVPGELRGAVSGIYSLFGAIGIILCSRLGGHLFDVWRSGAPFILMGAFHALLFGLGVVSFVCEKVVRRP